MTGVQVMLLNTDDDRTGDLIAKKCGYKHKRNNRFAGKARFRKCYLLITEDP